jgi:hypothetical protein
VSYLKVFRLTTSLIIIPSSTVTGAHNFGGCHAKQLASKAQLISKIIQTGRYYTHLKEEEKEA